MESQQNKETKKKISVLMDNPPLPGKKFFLASMISPESRQKNDIYALKFHDVCETEQEGKELCEYYKDLDPDFDVFLGTIGKWSPWVFNFEDVPSIEYANQQLNELVKAQRKKNMGNNKKWQSKVESHIDAIEYNSTKQGQQERVSEKEPAVAMLFRIKQLENVISHRKNELAALEDIYHEKYSKQDRQEAKSATLPISTPAPMKYSEFQSKENGPVISEIEDEPISLENRLHGPPDTSEHAEKIRQENNKKSKLLEIQEEKEKKEKKERRTLNAIKSQLLANSKDSEVCEASSSKSQENQTRKLAEIKERMQSYA